MAPPPMTTMRAGTWSRSSTSSLVMIGPPRSKSGIRRGTEPAARMTLSPVICVVEPSGAATVTVWSGPRLPTPLNTSTLRPLHIAAMPPTSPATIFCLRSWVTAKLTRRRAGLDAELGGVGDVAVDRGRLEERLGRDAATVEARAAEGVHLDHGDLDAGRRRVERGGVPTGSSADDDEIELIGRRDHLIRSVGSPHATRARRRAARSP